MANAILIVHALFIGAVIFSVPLILAGAWRGWGWVRNPWFRFTHLAMIAFVAAESLIGMDCPLTVWENRLRLRAGEAGYGENGFIAGWLHSILFYRFPAWVFTSVYITFCLLVISLFYFVPVRGKETIDKGHDRMNILKKITHMAAVALLAYVAYVAFVFDSRVDLAALPPLESGDLIFGTDVSSQALAIMLATGSTLTHVGVIHKQGDRISVIHASRTVIETSVASFVHGGLGDRFVIRRYPGLSAADRDAIAASAQHYIGRPYNYVFDMNSDQIYCSELPYLAFKEAGKPLGTLEKIGDLHVNNPPVRTLFELRWKMHPACQAPGMDYHSCWDKVMQEPIITPASVERDSRLVTLYDNYPY